MAHFYGEDSFIDESVMSAAYNYIMRRQKENGCFRREGAVHNYRLLVGCGGGLPGDTLLRVCCVTIRMVLHFVILCVAHVCLLCCGCLLMPCYP